MAVDHRDIDLRTGLWDDKGADDLSKPFMRGRNHRDVPNTVIRRIRSSTSSKEIFSPPLIMISFLRSVMSNFSGAWRHIAETADTHCTVLRAAPGRAFSSGVDVKAAIQPGWSVMHDDIWVAEDPGEALGPKSNRCWKPVICAVHGMAARGAFYWINESDIVICSEDTTFFDPSSPMA